MAPRETENNAYAKFCGDKQRALWYVMVFSGVVNRFRLAIEQLCTCITLFCTFRAPLLPDCDMKLPNFTRPICGIRKYDTKMYFFLTL